MLILKNSSLLSLNQFFSIKELLIFNVLLFQYKVLKKNQIDISVLKQKLQIKYSQNKNIKEILLQMSTKSNEIRYLNKQKGSNWGEIRYFKQLSINKNSVSFEFSEDILSFVNQKNSSFYNLNFNDILKINKVHSITVFELILDFTLKDKKETVLYFRFNFLRKILGLEDKYKKNSEFKHKVVEKIIENLNQVEGIELILLEKNKQSILKIVSKVSVENRDEKTEKVLMWLNDNPDEIELYKEAIISNNDKIDSKEVCFEAVQMKDKDFYVQFKYKSFLLEAPLVEEDFELIFNKERNDDFEL